MNFSPLCPICNSIEIKCFLERSGVPVHQNLLMTSQVSARNINRGNLILSVCPSCGFVFNQDFDLSKMNYSSDYNNTQTCSPFFDQYVNGLVQHISELVGDNSCSVIEIGCGKGDFIKRLVQSNPHITGYGFDPSYEGEDTCEDGRLTFIKDFYDAKYADIYADIVICRHVIEHLENPVQLLSTVRKTLRSSTKTKVFFETPCVDWILENQIYWDFFYEHCSYFTKNSLITAFEMSGFQVEEATHIFEGQYLWIEAKLGEVQLPAPQVNSGRTFQSAKDFARNEEIVVRNWVNYLTRLKEQGNIAIWGAGAKGVTIANMLDPDCVLISCIIDINPAKQGKYLPGTGHPIISYNQLKLANITNIIVMNMNYKSEIHELLKSHHIEVELVELETIYANNDRY